MQEVRCWGWWERQAGRKGPIGCPAWPCWIAVLVVCVMLWLASCDSSMPSVPPPRTLTLLPFILLFIKVHPSGHLSQGHCHHCGRQWEHEGPADDHCQTHHHHHFRYSGRKWLCQHHCSKYVPSAVLSCLPCASYQPFSPLGKLQVLQWRNYNA